MVVRQLVRPKGAQVAQPGAIGGQAGVFQPRLQFLIFQLVDFQREEQHLGGQRRRLLLHGLKKAGVFRIGNVAGIDQLRVGGYPPQTFLQRLAARDGRAQLRPGKACDLSLVITAKSSGVFAQLRQGAGQFRTVGTGKEVAQVPPGQFPQRLFRCVLGHFHSTFTVVFCRCCNKFPGALSGIG